MYWPRRPEWRWNQNLKRFDQVGTVPGDSIYINKNTTAEVLSARTMATCVPMVAYIVSWTEGGKKKTVEYQRLKEEGSRESWPPIG